MQWRRQRRVTHVIGSSNHALLLARYQDAPPGEEDEEEGLRNGFVKGQEKGNPSAHGFERNGRGGYTSRRSASGSSSGHQCGGGAKSHKDDPQGSPWQPKIIFNEDEYTRITTPRQDVLFKKGHLFRKKPWVGNASTSATPSTTESQSASHSTADGSETTEDQQLLDRDSGSGEYPPVMEPGTQLGYGTLYDHRSGYYYEYPVMLVGPTRVPAQFGPSVLATMPCGPVTLRPIEWINPAFVPKLGVQPYCMMDYQTGQNAEGGANLEEQETMLALTENANGTCNESCTGSASCPGSVVGVVEEHVEEEVSPAKEMEESEEGRVEEAQQPAEEQRPEEQYVEEAPQLENGTNGGLFLEPMLMQPPVHVSHVMPAVPQPYMYPGHYMFGPPLVNVNGVTLQSGPMIRTTDVAAMAMACGKRRKKKKRRKQSILPLDNAEDEEEAEYSSECDNGLPSSRVPWTGCPTSSTITTTTSRTQLLNPECQEFQLCTVVEASTSPTVVPTSHEITTAEEEPSGANSTIAGLQPSEPTTAPAGPEVACNGMITEDPTIRENGPVTDHAPVSSLENNQSTTLATSGLNGDVVERLVDRPLDKEVVAVSMPETIKGVSGTPTELDEVPLCTDLTRSANDIPSANEKCERSMDELNITDTPLKTTLPYPEGKLTNGEADSDSCSDEARIPNSSQVVTMSNPPSPQVNDSPLEKVQPKSFAPKTNSIEPVNESRRSLAKRDSSNNKVSNTSPKRKYSSKGSKFVREATPGPDLDNVTDADLDIKKDTLCNKTELSNNGEITSDACSKSQYTTSLENTVKTEDQESDNYSSEMYRNGEDKITQDEAIEASTEDSGFESQSRRIKYPITEAVKEWLRKANSPELFITCRVTSDSETEDEVDVKEKPPKNLHGNPMPALSANGSTDNDVSLSGAADYGEFARTSNNEGDRADATCGPTASRKKRDLKGTKRKSGERPNRRGARCSVERMQDQVVSSSDSCYHQENSLNTMRTKSLPKQNVGDFCEFSEKDSVAGMRVAVNSRVDSKRVNGRRAKRSGKSNREPVENVGLKMRRRVDDEKGKDGEGIVDDTVSVRTFEKGEIIVTEHGKLLTPSNYQPFVPNGYDGSSVINISSESECSIEKQNVTAEKSHNNNNNNNSSEEESAVHTMIQSVGSIEEPDVLECWEAETIEPVITPRKMLQSRGIYCEGEAAEDDKFEIEHANIEHVQKYYRLARESATSLEEEVSETKTCIGSPTPRTVPNTTEQMVESFYSKEIQVVLPAEQQRGFIGADKSTAPVDEAFEVYESCYTGKAQFPQIDSKLLKEKTLYGQTGEGPIPCRAACCNIQ